MPVYILEKELIFPPVSHAEPDGLLAMGGDLSPERLLLAYKNGIFPWYEGEHILWWSPAPRFILFPEKIKISKTMKALIKRESFTFTVNKAFNEVIHHCKNNFRPDQDGTWITDEIEKAFLNMHQLGHAQSAEAWLNGKLVGGLYGIKSGKVFFGESMFSLTSNASKFTFIKYCQKLHDEGVELIDCQVHTRHLESLGAEMIPRDEFISSLKKLVG